MAKNTVQSVEPNIADLVNGWLKSYKVDYKLEQESLNTEIDQALNDYFSKNGGKGGNRPDAKLLLQANDGKYYPILIEYKGYKDKLVKLDAEGNVANRNAKNQPDYTNINSYAVNGAVHYSNAVLHYTSYTDVIAIGVTGYKDASGKLKHLIGVYYVAKSNFGVGQKVDEYTDLSFLKKEHFSAFIEKVKQLSLPQDEIEKLKERREQEITASLVKLNNDIFKSEKGLSENDRVYLVVASIMATLGDVENNVYPLTKADLKSSNERNNTDGDIMIRKIESFLDAKKLPKDKKDLIVRTLQNTLTTDNINRAEDGESQLKRVFIKIVDDLGVYYKIGLNTDFTGKLFNEMYSWLGFTQDQLNDVVLTPPYARHWKIAKNCIVELPTKDGEIDFDFMESFVAELEAQRVAELSAYLTVSGYDNYELSAEELSALQRFTELDDDNWGTYTVGNLFEKIATKKLPYKAKELPKQPTDDYVLPCLTSSFQNQGLNYYAPKAGATVLNNVISIPSNSDVYRAYYQTRDFTVLSDAYAIRWKSEEIELSPNQYLFMVMCINKVTDLPIYSYKNKLGGWNVVKTKEIRLPEKNGKIDFAFMDTFISAIKKLAIKEVVLYSDRKIAATKELVSKNNQLNS